MNADMEKSDAAGLLFRAGIDHYQQGAPAKAALIFEELLREAPDHPVYLRLLGLSLVRVGRVMEGLPFLARAHLLAPGDGLAKLHYGVGLQKAGRYVRAAAMFRRSAILLPDNPAPWVNLSASLLALGHAKAARAAARRAIRIAPNLGDAYHALGLAESVEQRIGAAHDAFARATQLNPKLAEPWVGLGRALHQLGKTDHAMYALQRALQVQPDHAAAQATLAGFSILAGDVERAIGRLRTVLARDPTCIAARLNLVNALLLERDPRSALGLLEGPPPPGHDGVHYRAHHAMALLQLRRFEEARAVLDAIPPPFGDAEILILWRRVSLLLHDRKRDEADVLAATMEDLAANDQAALFEHRVIAYFDLAGFHAGAGRKDAAFRCWRDGHQLLSRTQPFSRARETQFIDATIAAFSAKRLQQGARAENRDKAPVFIVGMPRSGTSLTEQVLAAHRHVHGAGERPDTARLLHHLVGRPDDAASVLRAAALGAQALDRAATQYLATLHALAPDATIITDKMPGNARHLGFIATLLPNARIIHCRRDPRDIGLSIFKLRFFGYHPYAHDLSDLGWAIGQHDRLMTHWRAALTLPIIDVDLCDWVNDFAGTLGRLLEFLGLPYDPACERFHEQTRRVRTASSEQVRRPINNRGIGRWREYEANLAPLIDELQAAGLLN